MGMRLFSEGSTKAPNPDPSNFHILQLSRVSNLTIALVHYPGCTTFAGEKLLVYECSIEELNKQLNLDPHFTETGLSPIARFPATFQGHQDAALFARVRGEKRP